MHPADDNGPGVYDGACSVARNMTGGHTCLLLVLGGIRGPGFSVQTERPELVASVPDLLRSLADQIEENRRRT